MKQKYLQIFTGVLLLALVLSGCSVFETQNESQKLTASGTIKADTISISPEVSGKVVEIAITEYSTVSAGDLLFRVDQEILQAQYEQAQAAVAVAEATLGLTEEQLNAASLQTMMAEQGARLQALEQGQLTYSDWSLASPDEFQLPYWYFQKEEALQAAENEVEEAFKSLEKDFANLEKVENRASSEDFLTLEQDLADARARFAIAQQTLQQSQTAENAVILIEKAQDGYDKALADLDALQLEYEQILTTAAAEEVLEARAMVAISTARYDNAKVNLDILQTGQDSLQVQSARANESSAAALVDQARAGLAQAEAAEKIIEIQLEKTSVVAPAEGIILVNNLTVGELVGAGTVAMTIAQLDQVSLVVYVPEDVYGLIQLNQKVSVQVDSYPNKTYPGQVVSIAQEAEFTPRNVQTVEGRKSIVFAIEIRIENPNNELKPGMPADVDFGILY